MWDFLLYSLGNALDTVYYECELQSSSSKCEHVLALLAAFSQDFETLCDRLQRQEDFEVSLEEGNYASIAWEVRTASRLRSVHVDTSDDEKEEARLFYVAATRATQRLVVTVSGAGGFGARLAG